jgi:hypothetical protein
MADAEGAQHDSCVIARRFVHRNPKGTYLAEMAAEQLLCADTATVAGRVGVVMRSRWHAIDEASIW